MSSQLTQDDARAIARVLYAVHQRRAARLAAEQAQQATEHEDRYVTPSTAGGDVT
jgi:hypothetical protein